MKTVLCVAVSAVLLSLWTAGRPAYGQTFCIPGRSTLCLDGGRFKVDVTWRDAQGHTGTGQVATLGSDDSGLFWFFSAQNWELLVKVLNGCALNHHFWVFSSATTNVEYALRVTDTVTGVINTYRNPQGRFAPSVTDTSAFNTCSAEDVLASKSSDPSEPASAEARPRSSPAPTVSVGPCSANPNHSCLEQGRFEVEVSWQDSQGNTGVGSLAPVGSDDSSVFWFFAPNNWEMLVKVLDGCGLNQHFWVFSAATTNVHYTLHVTDRFTGAVKEYVNPQGRPAATVLDTSAFTGCDVTGPPQVQLASGGSLILTSPGQQGQLAAQVAMPDGTPIPDAQVTWSSSNPSLISVQSSGPLAATVAVVGANPGTSTVTAAYGGVEAQAIVLFATVDPGTALVTGDLVRQLAAGTIVLSRTSQTEALQPNQILVSGDGSGVLARIETVAVEPDEVDLQVTPATLPQAFRDLVVDATGQPVEVVSRVGRGQASVTSRRGDGRMVSKETLSGAECALAGGGAASLELDATVTLTHRLAPFAHVVIANHALQHFDTGIQGDAAIRVETGSVQFDSPLDGTVECTLPLPVESPVPLDLPIGPLWLRYQLAPTLGLDAEATFPGSSLRIGGPIGDLGGTVEAGFAYDPGTGWSPLAQKSWDGELTQSPPDLSTGDFDARSQLFGRLDVGLGISLGQIELFPNASRNLADLQFAQLEGYGYSHFSLPMPIDLSDPLYRGPSWELGAGIRGSLTADLSGGPFAGVLDDFGIGTVPGGPLDLFAQESALQKSPVPALAAPGGELFAYHPILVTASADPPATGEMEIWASSDPSSPFQAVAQGRFAQGSGQAIWTPGAGDVGGHTLRALLRSDDISAVLPYASSNTVAVAVDATATVTGISPDPVPGTGDVQTLTIYGSNFVSGASVTVTDLTFGGSPAIESMAYDGSGQLEIVVQVPAENATWAVQVTNPDGSSSNVFDLAIEDASPPPSISGASPAPVQGVDSEQTITILGSGFASGATVTVTDLTSGGSPAVSATTFDNSGEMEIVVDVPAENATWAVQVTNPNGRTSNVFDLTIEDTLPPPSISGISPDPVPGIDAEQTITIYGSNFISGATLTMADLTNGGGPYTATATFDNSGQLEIDADVSAEDATWSVQVTNPDGAASNVFYFSVQIPDAVASRRTQLTHGARGVRQPR